MIAAFALPLVALLSAHVPGVSQGDVVVDGAGRDVTVEVDVVFARGDAARLPAPFVVATAGGAACVPDPVAASDAVDVEGDGRALRVLARCAGDGDVVVDVVGLRALPPEHRMALRVVDDAGTHDFVLSPGDTAATLRRARAQPRARPTGSAVAVAVAAVVVGFGARRPRAFVATAGLALLGVGVALLARPFLAGADDADVSAVVRVVVAALAVAGVALDPRPRARVAALALGALAALAA